MKKDKKGFTLGEVLITMVIIGVIMTIAMNSIRIVKASYTSLTYFTLKNLKDMVGIVYSGQTSYTDARNDDADLDYVYDASGNKKKDEKGNYIKVHKRQTATDGTKIAGFEELLDNAGEGIPNPVTVCRYTYEVGGKTQFDTLTVLKNDNEYTNEKGIRICNISSGDSNARTKIGAESGKSNVLFCEAMAGIANTASSAKCSRSTDFSTIAYDNTYGPYISSLTSKPNFITTNGQKYYISKWSYNAAVSEKYGYRIIAVDLNGGTGPNKLDAIKTTDHSPNPADIVQFLVMDNGQVYPLGYAANNKSITNGKTIQYLTSQVKGYYFDSTYASRENVNIPEECNPNNEKRLKTADGNTACNFGRVDLVNEKQSDDTKNDFNNFGDKDTSLFTYRKAFCAATPSENIEFKNYCTLGGKNYTKSQYCPPSSDSERFDECRVVNIKPMFRYNFK